MLAGMIDFLGTVFNVIGNIIDTIIVADAVKENKGNWVWKVAAAVATVSLICLLIYAYGKCHHS